MVRKRLKALEEALASRGRMEGELQETSRWLHGAQDELRRVTTAVGHRTEDARDLLSDTEQLVDRLDAFKVTGHQNLCLPYPHQCASPILPPLPVTLSFQFFQQNPGDISFKLIVEQWRQELQVSAALNHCDVFATQMSHVQSIPSKTNENLLVL